VACHLSEPSQRAGRKLTDAACDPVREDKHLARSLRSPDWRPSSRRLWDAATMPPCHLVLRLRTFALADDAGVLESCVV
jgi:hypothetical protein